MVYVPSHRGHGSEVPTPFVVAYVAVALLVWFVVAVITTRRTASSEHRGAGPVPPPTGEQIGMGLMVGACAALMWPLSLVAGGMWLGIRRLTRTPAPARIELENPRNGHGWRCRCGECAVFWDTAEGERAYQAAVTRARGAR